MSSSVRIEIRDDGIQAILKGPEMQALVKELAEQKVSEAGEGYACSVKIGVKRCYANIYPETPEAKKDNLDNNTLEKIIRST